MVPPYDGGSATLVNWLGLLALSPCGLATYDMQTEMSSSPPTGKGASYWRFMFACWQTYRYFNIVSNIVNKKLKKKKLFFCCPFSY
jgi:hypothetical protein